MPGSKKKRQKAYVPPTPPPRELIDVEAYHEEIAERAADVVDNPDRQAEWILPCVACGAEQHSKHHHECIYWKVTDGIPF